MKELRTVGRPISMEVYVHSMCKYIDTTNQKKVVRYDNVENWEIITNEDAEEIEKEIEGMALDDYHEYVVLHFTDGTLATFRNSYVDLFRV